MYSWMVLAHMTAVADWLDAGAPDVWETEAYTPATLAAAQAYGQAAGDAVALIGSSLSTMAMAADAIAGDFGASLDQLQAKMRDTIANWTPDTAAND